MSPVIQPQGHKKLWHLTFEVMLTNVYILMNKKLKRPFSSHASDDYIPIL